MTARIVPALLAAMATIVVAIPLSALFEDATWVMPAGGGVLLVALTGILLRASVGHTGVTILGQLVAASAYVLVTQLGETTVFGVLPTPETFTRIVEHVRDAQETITRYAAPAPETAGITVVLVAVVIVVGLAVDMSAATAGAPSIAGLPLLSLFLVSAANSGGSLPWGWFLAGSALWLAMVAHQSDIDLTEWTTSIPLLGQGEGQGIAARSLRWQAARMSALCLAAAMVLPAVLPHLPTRYLLDGLGQGGAGSAGTTDGIRLSTELDLKRSLESPSQEPVLSYTTDDPSPEPLRVAVVEDFTDGFGRMRTRAREPREGFRPSSALSGVPEEIPRERRTLVVDANGVAAPQLAVPDNLASADVGGVPWSLGPDGTARVQRSPGTYSATFTELDIEEEHFGSSEPTTIDPTADRDENLGLDPGSATQIQALAERLAPSGGEDLAAAQAFQEYLRSPDFTYSLDIPRPPDGPSDPVLSFLETKTGYCQQFAATMTLLARAHGIPARVVVGFLPGDSVDEDEYLVRASDAHAWPELYFESVGWVRFEPTPGSRAAGVPGYTINTDSPGIATEDTTGSTETTTTTTPAVPEEDEDVTPQQPAEEGWLRRWSGWILAALLGVAALAILPVTAVLARRRERTTAVDDTARIEREWRDLIDRVEDLGVEPPSGATPRDVGAWLSRRAHLEAPARDQLDHVVATLERARYGRPGQDLPDVSAEVTAIVAEVRDQRMRSARVRAALVPRAGVDAWRSLPRRLADRLHR